nr:MAG TPA: hypothetical protein [Caudoviricetes sp.]
MDIAQNEKILTPSLIDGEALKLTTLSLSSD